MKNFQKSSLTLSLGLVIVPGSLAQTDVGTAPVLLSGSSTAPAFTAQRVQTGRDKFSNTPALTTEGLVENLKTNKTFRVNLAKHFGVPEDRVIEFVQDALVPQVLTTDTRVMNYGVTKSGRIYSKNMTLKKGTRVWATRDGKPILKWDCSNPLLPKVPVLRQRPTPAQVSSETTKGLLAPGASLLDPSGIEAPVGITLAMDTPTEPIQVPSPPVKIVEEPDLKPQLRTTGGGARVPLLPLAGVVGVALRSTSSPSNVIPEPGTLAFLTLGGGGLLALRRRRLSK